VRARAALALTALAPFGCGEVDVRVLPPEAPAPAERPRPIGDPMTSDRDNDGWLDRAEVAMGTDPDSVDRPCARRVTEVDGVLETLNTKLDLIVLLDTSGSMLQELPSVRQGLLATLERAERGGGDVRLVVISSPSVWCGQRDCDPPPSPYLTYVEQRVNSRDTFDVFLETYPAWSAALRADASVAMLNVTDDDSRVPWRTFEAQLRALAPQVFFPNGRRGYTWHAATGLELAPDAVATAGAAAVDAPCATAPNAGLEYQNLSRFTGGLRFSVCGENDYTRVLDEVVFTATQPAECAISLATEDGVIDPSRSTVQLEPDGGPPEVLERVGEACARRGYYVVGDYVVLCEEVCDELEGRRVTLRAGAACVCGSSPTIGCEG
jgi:hypothetical protein